jgi:hypothetical protein
LRQQAVEWLRADLDYWKKAAVHGRQDVMAFIRKTLEQWKREPDLAGIRDLQARKRLPQDEQKALGALWDEVDALLASSRERR